MPFATYAAIFFCACKSCFARRPVIRRIAGSLARLAVSSSFWLALLDGNPRDIEFVQMLSYVFLIAIFYSLLPAEGMDARSAIWNDHSIAFGSLRPYAFQPAFHATLLGRSVGRFCTVSLPATILFGFLFGIPLPVDLSHGLLSLLQAAAGLLLTYQILYLFGMLAKRCAWFDPTGYFHTAMLVFGGTMAPIWLYPDFLQRLCMFLPFRLCTIEAVYSYIGKNSLTQAFLALAAALLWTCVLYLAGQILWRGLEKKMLLR